MDLTRLIEVLEITLPVFAMIGLGKILSVKGFINEERKSFLNVFVNTFSLPSLVFINVVSQDFEEMWNPALILPSFLAVVVLTLLYMVMVKIFGYKGGFAAAWVFGTFWANIAYIGFPMSELSYGDTGIGLTAVYNAYFMLVYIPFAFILSGIYGSAAGDISPLQRVMNIFKNPILWAVILGSGIAFVYDCLKVEVVASDGAIVRELVLPGVLQGVLNILAATLRMVGSMGLPMALLAIGAAMHMKTITDKLFALIMVVLGKTVFLPALTLILTYWLYPQASTEVVGIAVLLSAMPDAVASYVIAKQMGVEEGFVSSMLVLSTALSIITIPVWLYIVL